MRRVSRLGTRLEPLVNSRRRLTPSSMIHFSYFHTRERVEPGRHTGVTRQVNQTCLDRVVPHPYPPSHRPGSKTIPHDESIFEKRQLTKRPFTASFDPLVNPEEKLYSCQRCDLPQSVVERARLKAKKANICGAQDGRYPNSGQPNPLTNHSVTLIIRPAPTHYGSHPGTKSVHRGQGCPGRSWPASAPPPSSRTA